MAGKRSGTQVEYLFRDTGITVKIRKVSPMVSAEVARAMPDPEPPLQEVDYGEPKGKVFEKNYADPSYQVILAEHKQKIFEKLQRTMILRAVEVEGEDWKEEVAEYRAFMQDAGVEVKEPNDLIVYIMHICVGTKEDLEDLIEAITSRSQPTEKEVDLAKSSFRN